MPQVTVAFAIELRFWRRLRRRTWANFHGLGFETPVGRFPIRTTDRRVLADVHYCGGLTSFRDHGLVRYFEDARFLFAGDGERLGGLIDRRNGPTKWNRTSALGGGRRRRRSGCGGTEFLLFIGGGDELRASEDRDTDTADGEYFIFHDLFSGVDEGRSGTIWVRGTNFVSLHLDGVAYFAE